MEEWLRRTETKNPRLYQFEAFAGQNAIGVIES
jgi:hypothetical protein